MDRKPWGPPIPTVSKHGSGENGVPSPRDLAHSPLFTMLNIICRFSSNVVTKKQVYFDTVVVRAIGGTGGRGVSAFQSSCIMSISIVVIQPGKFTPTGGNGGKGGNVYVRVNDHLDALLLPKSVYKAENGQNGKGVRFSPP